MSLTKQDKKDMKEIVGDAISEDVVPILTKMMETLDQHSVILSKHSVELKELKIGVSNLQATTNRIELMQMSELNRVDDHEVRIVKLEKVKSH